MAENAPLARLCEELGFDYLWHSNERFFREMFIRMASSVIATRAIQIGGAIVEPFAVHPLLTAQTLATLNELSEGRTTVAIGAGGSGFHMMGIKRQHSAQAVREAYTMIRSLLAGSEVTTEGEVISAYRARLQFTPSHPVPLWVATRGDLTLRTSGEYADAIMIATNAAPRGICEAIELIRKGTKKAGRSWQNIRLLSRVDTCVHPDRQIAYEGTRTMIARILAMSYPDRNFVARAGLEVPKEMEAIFAKKDPTLIPEAARLVPDEFVSAFSWAGTPEMVAEQVVSVANATGLHDFGFWLLLAPGQTRVEAVKLLAQEVLPLVKKSL
ncbi:MAG: LLM class flavin-dependent oxidoreductase [Acidobacteriaceae bacterium]